MKQLLLILALTTNTAIFANEPKELFSAKQNKEVISLIDSICGDTWCEGDYNFKFTKFTCNKSTYACDLSFYLIKTDEQDVAKYSPVQICHIENIKNIKQVKNNHFSLNDNFYEIITDCISNIEAEVEF